MTEKELQEKYGDELVLCVGTRHFEDKNTPEERLAHYSRIIELYGEYMLRYLAENDENMKQIIPYVVLKSGDKYMFTKRLAGDPRLTGKYTIGMGGHINYGDLETVKKNDGYQYINPSETIHKCIMRELAEETTVEESDNIQKLMLSLIDSFIDLSEPVSRVHACILYVCEVPDTDVGIREVEKLEAKWLSLEEVTDEIYNSLEGWSKIAYNILFGERKPAKKKAARKTRAKKEVENETIDQ
ncbi:NUDIX domain-containing protein [Eubacterium limosum]|uniref:NUDIX domain-containing protein n=1 Tax=Eubacterium limosum TaxID=1736 RepID=UPI001062EF90|nr:NUDIX domain-containing protein [Eubacterium limosum]